MFGFASGNKTDRTSQREIPVHIGEDFARRYEMHFLETSAKEADNVDRLFMEIAKELTEQAKNNDTRPRSEKGLPTPTSPTGNGYCGCRT